MSIFEALGQKQAQVQSMNPMQALNELKANPAAMLKRAGLDVPDGMTDPRQITQHLLQSGQVQPARYQQALRMMGRR